MRKTYQQKKQKQSAQDKAKQAKKETKGIIQIQYLDPVTRQVIETNEQYTTAENIEEYKDQMAEGNLPEMNEKNNKFVILNVDFLKESVSSNSKLTKLAWQVLAYILLKMAYNQNSLISTQKKIAHELGVSPSKVSEAIKELVLRDICLKTKSDTGGNAFLVNPSYARKGNNLRYMYSRYNNARESSGKKFEGTNSKFAPSNSQKKTKNNVTDNKVTEFLQNSIKYGVNGTQLKLYTFLEEQFKHGKTLKATIQSIAKSTKVNRLTVIKCLHFLESVEYIRRKRGLIELAVSYKHFREIPNNL